MLHHPIFTEKYLQVKQINFSLEKIEGIEGKKAIIEKWKKSITSGRIIKTKEEAIQADFLNRFFGDVLGYHYQADDVWNLEKEFTVHGGKKADGALGYFYMKDGKIESSIRAVIELKDARTDLDKPQNRKDDKRSPVEQAFSYASRAGGKCKWVIVSNFKEIRLYHASDQSRYESWDITELLQENNLKRFFFLLQKGRLFFEREESFTDILYRERQAEEQQISKKFYSDYKTKRISLFHHIREKNSTVDELELFNKSQKLVDRLIFIFFCEDVGLIPAYTVKKIRDLSEKTFDMSPTKLWNQLKGLFHSVDKGNPPMDINKFNGGLFAPDAVLDSLIIEDTVLRDVLKLADYDFASDLNVNILGHIFEQSITDIEEIKAEIRGEKSDKKTGKRKKDGIFYTPEYITRYIVKEAVGGWLEDRKQELGFEKLPELEEKDFDSIKIGKGGKLTATAKIKKHIAFWEAYKDKLSNIKVLDPACGSGAFLNQVFDYLYIEGQKVNTELARLRGGMATIFDLDKHILTNNIYGVDLNPESVEITKLSLWLKTANKHSALTALDENIKCGNSLIDDPEIAGEYAFKWEEEFKNIMENGGFDVVVGNPPYLRVQGLKQYHKEQTIFFEKEFKASTGNYDIYALFIEKAHQIINPSGYTVFILPHKFLIADFGIGLREFLFNNKAASKILHFGSELVFEDATTYTCIFELTKRRNKELFFKHLKPKELFEVTELDNIKYEDLNTEQWILSDSNSNKVLEKIKLQPLRLKDVFKRFVQGIITGKDAVFCVKGKIEDNYLLIQNEDDSHQKIEKSILKPHLRGENIGKYLNLVSNEWLIFPYQLIDEKAIIISPEEFKQKYPYCWEYLKSFEEILREREKGKFDNELWYQYSRNQAISVMEQPKLITPEVCFGSSITYDCDNYYHNSKCHTLLLNEKSEYTLKSILPIINSKLFWFYLSQAGNILRGGYIGVKRKVLEPFPVPEPKSLDKKKFEKYTESMMERNQKLDNIIEKFIDLLLSDFEMISINTKIKSWNSLEWKDFEKELKKQKITLKGEQKDDWYDRFHRFKKQAQELQESINKTDKEIDQMVYELYGLTEEEIGIVENI